MRSLSIELCEVKEINAVAFVRNLIAEYSNVLGDVSQC